MLYEVITPWGWGLPFMFTTFGWKAVIGIAVSNAIIYFIFRQDLKALERKFKLSILKTQIREKYIQSGQIRQDLQKAQERISYNFV